MPLVDILERERHLQQPPHDLHFPQRAAILPHLSGRGRRGRRGSLRAELRRGSALTRRPRVPAADGLTAEGSLGATRAGHTCLMREWRSPPAQKVITMHRVLDGLWVKDSMYKQMYGWRSDCSSFT